MYIDSFVDKKRELLKDHKKIKSTTVKLTSKANTRGHYLVIQSQYFNLQSQVGYCLLSLAIFIQIPPFSKVESVNKLIRQVPLWNCTAGYL